MCGYFFKERFLIRCLCKTSTYLYQFVYMLFLLLLIGYIFGKKGLADGTGKNLLTDLVIYVTLPGSIIKSFQIEFNHQILIACMTIAIAGIT